VQKPSSQGFSAHLRLTHPLQWKGDWQSSIPSTFDAGKPEPRFTKSVSDDARRQKDRERHKQKRAEQRQKRELPMLSRVKFCPNCGHNIEIINIALGMAEKAQR